MTNLASTLGRRGAAEAPPEASPLTEPDTRVRPAVDPSSAAEPAASQRDTIPASGLTGRRRNATESAPASASPRVSGIQQLTVRAVVSPEDAVRRANAELEDRVGDKLQLPLAVLINQRDRALRGLAEAHTHAEQSLRDLTTDHDRFVAFVMHENAQRVAALEATLQTERARAVRAEVQVATLGAVPERASQEFNQDLAEAQAEILELKEAVRLLEGEVEETRAEAVRLQGERDEAIRSTDDLRLDLLQDLEAARAEAADFQARFDATERALLDARDQARDEVAGLTEQIVELQRVADKRSV